MLQHLTLMHQRHREQLTRRIDLILLQALILDEVVIVDDQTVLLWVRDVSHFTKFVDHRTDVVHVAQANRDERLAKLARLVAHLEGDQLLFDDHFGVGVARETVMVVWFGGGHCCVASVCLRCWGDNGRFVGFCLLV